MKRTIIYIILLVAFSSCKKSWLEIVPVGSLVATTTDDYDKLMNDPAYYLYAWQGGWQEPMYMGDEVAAEGPYFSNTGVEKEKIFRWVDSIYIRPDQSAPALTLHNTQMYPINMIIANVLSSTGGTTERKNGIRAEALATRAWSHFNMVNYYCKPYVETTASTDPGFPIIDKADVNVTSFPRGTLKQSYDFIINDLKEALQSIPARPTIGTRMSRLAVEGLLGKVYLFMGKPAAALPYLKDALAHVAANGTPALYDYNVTFESGGSFLPIDPNNGPLSPGQNPSDIQEAVVSKVWNCGPYQQFPNNGLVLTPQAAALFGASDLRLRWYKATNPDNTPNAGGRLRKYGLQYARYGLQLPELYLLSAECKARTNDLTGAVADLEELRRHRMPATDAVVPATIATNQNELIKFVIDERIREFASEGYRWFDMRRLAVDPLFAGINFKHTVYNADGSTTVYTLQLPNRLVLMFPRNIMDANPDMKNNP